MKYDVSKINIILFTQQVGWFGGKKVELHPWGSRIELYICDISLCSTLEYWYNIL